MKIAELIEEDVTVRRATGLRFRSAATILRMCARVAGVMEINDVTQETVRTFLKGSGPITSGWHQKHYTLAGLFRFAMQRSLVSTSPVAYRLPSGRRTQRTLPYLEKPEMDALLAAPDRRTSQGARDHALLHVSVQRGRSR